MPEREARACLHLNEDESRPITHDHVNLAAGTPPVASENLAASALQKTNGEIFTKSAQPTAWRIASGLRHARQCRGH
jgi:hypothetical protein